MSGENAKFKPFLVIIAVPSPTANLQFASFKSIPGKHVLMSAEIWNPETPLPLLDGSTSVYEADRYVVIDRIH